MRKLGMKSTFTYTGIRVKDLNESVKFYTELLGMKEIGRTNLEATGGIVASLVSEDGGPQLELNFYPKGNKFAAEYVAGEGLDHLAFRVKNLDEALADAAKAGHRTILDIKTTSSRWAYIEDPNGIYIELFE
jgi:lactoylglutathione lyase